MFVLSLFSVLQADAAPGDNLMPKVTTFYIGSDPNGTGMNGNYGCITKTTTKGNCYAVPFSGTYYLNIIWDKPYSIGKYAGSYWKRLVFYDSSDNVLRDITNPAGGSITLSPPVHDVKRVLIYLQNAAYQDNVFFYESTPPPLTPTNLKAVGGVQSIDVTWNELDDSNNAGYNVYVDGVLANTVLIPKGTHSYKINGLKDGTSYSIQVTSKTIYNDESQKATAVVAKTIPPPVTPVLTGVADIKYIDLMWNDSGLSYSLYLSGVGGNALITTTDKTSYRMDGLAFSTDYKFYVVATDQYERKTSSQTITVKTKDPPAPIKPTLSYNSTYSDITVLWSTLSTSYEVWNSFGGKDYLLGNVTTNSYTVTGLSPDTIADFYVIYVDDYGRRVRSDTLSASTKPMPPPVFPKLDATPNITEIALKWDNIGYSYDVYQVGTPEVKLTTVNAVSYFVKNLSPDKTYDFYVQYTDTFGRLIKSNVVSTKTGTPPPPVKPILSASNVTYKTFDIAWKADASYTYEIFVDDKSIGAVSGPTKSIIDLLPNTIYKVKLKAVDAFGQTIESDVLAVTTSDIPKPFAPELKYTSLKSDSVYLYWNDVSAKKYQVFLNGHMVKEINSFSYSLNDLNPSATYSIKLVATDQYDRSVDSNVLTLTTLAAPPAPTPTVPPAPPPKVLNSGNEDMNHSGDYLVQGTKDANSSWMDLIMPILEILILVVAVMFLMRLWKKKMAQANKGKKTSQGGQPKEGSASKLNLSTVQRAERNKTSLQLDKSIVSHFEKKSQGASSTTMKQAYQKSTGQRYKSPGTIPFRRKTNSPRRG